MIEIGEGIFGLRRAFEMAGARTVVSSLWPINDKITSEIMSKFYTDLNKPVMDRLRDLQLEKISQLRKAGLGAHPFLWGAFIASGDWK